MKDVQVRLSTLLAVTAIVGAGAFAAGRSTSSGTSGSMQTAHAEPPPPPAAALPAEGDNQPLPPNHPPIGNAPGDPHGGGGAGAGHDDNAAAPATITWKVPPRWKEIPNTSSMRIATYRVPHAAGEETDADVSVMQAGGSVESNVERWIGQFGPEAKSKSKSAKKKIGQFEVTIVEAEGTYGGMGGGKAEENAALLGAIVETPDMPHFFKITGSKKTVQSARAELDALLASIAPK